MIDTGPDAASPILVLEGWHRAVNAADDDTAVGWCSDDVAVQGPRGTGHGHDLMRAWLTRSGIRLHPQGELVEVDGRVVIRELAQWTAADAPAGAPTGDPVETWCVFTVSDGLVTSVARYETEAEIPPVDPAV
ncbi:MAG: nuclear transport factor 2 family protein [Nocardioidaceae bacterium]